VRARATLSSTIAFLQIGRRPIVHNFALLQIGQQTTEGACG